ncbi:MAG: hypothetical protein ABJO09_00860 [Hyphomicrobiales bacterium]
MNDIAKIDQSIPQPKPTLVTGGAIASIVPSNIEEAFRLSDALHKSAMAPKDLDTTQKVMIAMISGMEVGLPPMAAVQSVAVINNRPSIWGDALIGIVRKSPLCTYVKEWVDGENDDMVAYCETLRKGESEPVLKTFSAKHAMRAGHWQTEKIVTRRARADQATKNPTIHPGINTRNACCRCVCVRGAFGMLCGCYQRQAGHRRSSQPPRPRQCQGRNTSKDGSGTSA